MKYCQGPLCHTYDTKDRKRGPKGNKTYQTRRRSNFYYLGGNACDMRCQADWFERYGEQAVNHFGRITEPLKLTVDNAWYKDNDYDWQSSTHSNWRFVNKLTNEVRPITEQQYRDTSFTLNTR